MKTKVTVKVASHEDATRKLLVPLGLSTPHQVPVSFDVTGGSFSLVGESTTGQMAAAIEPDAGASVEVSYVFDDGGPGYPDAVFIPRLNRFTRAARDLVDDAIRLAEAEANGHDAIQSLVNAAAEKFRYTHPEVRFNDGLEEVPYLSCGLTEGSCVDINTYLIASLRAAGFEAGYVTGYFFPEEKQGCCEDMHCWVVTRHEGVVLEWDIAHHLKMGTRVVCCGLNPKPGDRVAVAHSMGLSFPVLGIECEKLIAEPAWISGHGQLQDAALDIWRQKITEAQAA